MAASAVAGAVAGAVLDTLVAGGGDSGSGAGVPTVAAAACRQ